jgi:hypothetical protein
MYVLSNQLLSNVYQLLSNVYTITLSHLDLSKDALGAPLRVCGHDLCLGFRV